MYLILTASSDTYITNKIITNTASTPEHATATLAIGGVLDFNTKITIVSSDLTSKTYLATQNGHGSIAIGDLIEIGDIPEGPNIAATATLTTTGNGTDAHGLTAGQKITLISTDATSKTYVIVDPALSDANTTAVSHNPLVANAVLGNNATVTGVKAVVDDALLITGAANGHTVRFNVPSTANGEAGNVDIKFVDALGAAEANVIQVQIGGLNQERLIRAVNGTADAGIEYGTGRGSAAAGGIAGITASAGSAAGDAHVKLTLDRPGVHAISLTNVAGTVGQGATLGANYFSAGGGAVTAGTAGEIAVMMTGNQATVLNALRAAIINSNGHDGKITVTAALNPENAVQSHTLTQAVAGVGGNRATTEDLTTVVGTNFTGGNTFSAIEAGDPRIGLVAVHAGNNGAAAANALAAAINSSNGNNAGSVNSKIRVANNGSGTLTLTQVVGGNAGNQRVIVQSDDSNRISIPDEGFVDGKDVPPIRATDANVGMAGTLDIFKLYGENTIVGGEEDLIELSRALIKFDHEEILPFLSKSLDITSANFRSEIRLKDVTTGHAAPTNLNLLALPLSKSFDEGIGRAVSTFNDLDTANFLTASFTAGEPVLWTVRGANATGSAPGNWDAITAVAARSPFPGAPNSNPLNSSTTIDLKSEFTLKEGTEDVVFNVTNALSSTLKSDISNHGFRISIGESQENNERTYFLKRLGSRHVRNVSLRPELHVYWDDSQIDNFENSEFDVNNTVFLRNYKQGIAKNIRTGTIGQNPVMSDLVGANCMKLILSKSELKKTYNASQVLKGTNGTGDPGSYSATFNMNLFEANILKSSIPASTTLTFLGGPVDVNTRITLISTDGTSKTYLGITEDHGSIANGDIIAVGDNPDGSAALLASDERIGDIAFMVGSSNIDAASTFASVLNLANGHNAGSANSKITIANNNKGILTLTQTVAGSSGNSTIKIEGDTSRRFRVRNNRFRFTGGSDALTVENEARASGSVVFDAFWKSNDETVTYHKTTITVRTSSLGDYGHGETRPTIIMTNLKDIYKSSDDVRLRLFAFDQNQEVHEPVKIPHERRTKFMGDIYWRLVSETTGQIVMEYQIENNATRLSFDRTGYYFDFLMASVPVGITCRFEFCRKFQGKTESLFQRRFARFRVRN